MNITSCPQCGGRVRSVTIGWKCENCNGFIDMQGEFHQHKEEPFMPTMTNADRIRAMSDEELAERIWPKFGCPNEKNHVTCGYVGECKDCWMEWLQQSAEEDA